MNNGMLKHETSLHRILKFANHNNCEIGLVSGLNGDDRRSKSESHTENFIGQEVLFQNDGDLSHYYEEIRKHWDLSISRKMDLPNGDQ